MNTSFKRKRFYWGVRTPVYSNCGFGAEWRGPRFQGDYPGKAMVTFDGVRCPFYYRWTDDWDVGEEPITARILNQSSTEFITPRPTGQVYIRGGLALLKTKAFPTVDLPPNNYGDWDDDEDRAWCNENFKGWWDLVPEIRSETHRPFYNRHLIFEDPTDAVLAKLRFSL